MTEATLGKLYAEGVPVADIAAAASCDLSTVHRRLRRLGVSPRGRAPVGRALTKPWIKRRLDRGMSVPDIAREADCDRRVVADAILRHGLGVTTTEPAAELRRLYVADGLSTYVVAERMGVSPRTVRRRLQGAGIAMRPRGHPAA